MQSYLVSNAVKPNNAEQCLEFFFLRTLSPTGTLSAYAKLASQNMSTLGFPIWTEKFLAWYDTKPSWQRAQVSLGHAFANQPFEVVFEEFVPAEVGRGNGGFFGNFFGRPRRRKSFNVYLDDVFIRDRSCLPPGDCDFENGLCKATPTSYRSLLTS